MGSSTGSPWVFLPFLAPPRAAYASGQTLPDIGPMVRRAGMSAGGGYEVGIEEMRGVIRGLMEVTAQIQGAIGHLGGLSIPGGCFGGVGSSVATANAALQARSVTTLATLLSALQELNRRLTESVDGYDRADRGIAATLATLARSEPLHRRPR
jgi:hypothetical protein